MNPGRAVLPSIVVLSVLFYSSIIFAAPPKVVKTVPENGDMNVKPGPTKIRILFDQDMIQGGYSIVGGGEKYPEIIGKPQWVGKRALVFSAKLVADHEYEFMINSSTFKNCKGINGEPAEVCRVWFKTIGDNVTAGGSEHMPQLTEEENKAAIEKLKSAVTRYYFSNEPRKVDWNTGFGRYEQRLLKAKTSEEFARISGLLLAEAKDKHIWLMVDGKHISAYVNPVAPNANFELLPKLVPNFQKRNDIIYTGRFTDGIGYIRIDSWVGTQERFAPLYEVLKEFADSPGLIIDIRCNGGGDERNAQMFAGCFTAQSLLYAKHQSINPDTQEGFGPVQNRYVMSNENGPKYRRKVIVLIGPVVFSSAEEFASMMKQVPGCKTAGQTTQGGSGNPLPYELGNGVEVYLPSWKRYFSDGTWTQGKGILPDIKVDAGVNQFKSNDPVLEAALKELQK